MKVIKYLAFSAVVAVCSTRCNNSYTASKTSVNYQTIEASSTTNEKLEELISPYDEALKTEMSVVIGSINYDMFKARPEGLLSNFTADLVLSEVNEMAEHEADICLLNHGGLRAPLLSGKITVGNVYELMPFENEIVILELEGKKIAEIANYFSETGGEPIANAEINLSAKSILISGKEINPNLTYKVATTDYLANGGDKMYFFSKPVNYVKTGVKMRDMIINHIKEETLEGKVLKAELDGRVRK